MSEASHYERLYLGDGVYCQYNGYHFVLTVNHGIGIEQIIYIDPMVYEAFLGYHESIINQSSK